MTDTFGGLQAIVGLAALWLLTFVLLRDYMTDRFRQEMFILRDKLFDYAASGAIPFDHPAYGHLRITMNGMIRFAHRISFVRVLLMMLFGRSTANEVGRAAAQRWEETVSTVEGEEVQSTLRDFHMETYIHVLKHILLTSPTLLLVTLFFLIPVLVFGAVKKLCDEIVGKLQPVLSVFEEEANEEAYRAGARAA